MRWIPERDEALALMAVWLIWPALHFTAWAVLPVLAQLGASLPLLTRLAFQVLQANRLCVPSLVGTAAIGLVGRLAPSPEVKRFALHLITLSAFAFTVVTMLAFLTVVRAVT
jgi:hypothetical protein